MGQQLSDTEALLWSLGRDPNLASTMGFVAILDGKPDLDRLRATVASTVAAVDRLRQRVVTPTVSDARSGAAGGVLGTGAFAKPEWVVDDQFDFDHHVRTVRLATPGPAGEADLRRAAARFINDPFDLARPLWQFLIVIGLARGRAALIGKVHHSISDGIGLLRLAANLLEFEADAEPPPAVQLDAVFATDGEVNGDAGQERRSGPVRMLGWVQSAVDNIPNPVRLIEAGADAVASARTVGGQLPKSHGSQLWSTRSRNRRLEFCAVSLDSLQERADALEVTLNDLFVAACAQAAVHYHERFDAELPTITATVVINTANASGDEPPGSGDNSFLPVAIELPGLAAPAEERLQTVHDEIRRRRAELDRRSGAVQTISAIGGLVPSSVAAALALDQAAKVDFATSNIPGPPMSTWLAGRPIRRMYPVGPVAGTAFNITLMTFDREALMGIHLDPAAVADPAALQRAIARGFTDFGVSRR